MKHCKECGCLMTDTHDSDVCEVCSEEMGGLSSDLVIGEDVESAYPSVEWPKDNPFLSKPFNFKPIGKIIMNAEALPKC